MSILTIFYQIVCGDEILVDNDEILVDNKTRLSELKEFICDSYERLMPYHIKAIIRDEFNTKFKTGDDRKTLKSLNLRDNDAITIVLFTEWLEEYNNDNET